MILRLGQFFLHKSSPLPTHLFYSGWEKYNNNKKTKNKLCIDKENPIIINSHSKRLEWVYFDVDDKLFEIVKNKKSKIYLNVKDNKQLNIDVDTKV